MERVESIMMPKLLTMDKQTTASETVSSQCLVPINRQSSISVAAELLHSSMPSVKVIEIMASDDQ